MTFILHALLNSSGLLADRSISADRLVKRYGPSPIGIIFCRDIWYVYFLPRHVCVKKLVVSSTVLSTVGFLHAQSQLKVLMHVQLRQCPIQKKNGTEHFASATNSVSSILYQLLSQLAILPYVISKLYGFQYPCRGSYIVLEFHLTLQQT